MFEHIARGLAAVRARIGEAAARSGRQAADIRLIAVSKTYPIDAVRAAADAGQEDFGENRVQEALDKIEAADRRVCWHLIGHLQSNKAKVVNGICELVHSLASESAAQRLTVPALIEVNLSGEPSKSGVAPEELPALVAAYPDTRGLMTMPPAAADPEASRPYFRRLRELAAEHGLPELSMGTSQDYRVAVEEGATLIRVGSVLFGP